MSALAGTAPLVRLALRRDRWLLSAWVILLGAFPMLMVAPKRDQFPTPADRAELVRSIADNPGLRMISGPVNGPSIGALATWKVVKFIWVPALVSVLLVIRHTRAEEEAGRRELVGSTVVGRLAPSAAALAVVFTGNLAVAVVAAAGMLSQGLPLPGSVALGAGLAAAGWVFAGVAAAVAQLTESAATARGIAAGLGVGGAFLLRGIGDAAGIGGTQAWPTWLSPLGWPELVRPYADERWGLLVVAVVVTLVLVAGAAMLAARRDVGAGLLPTRPGAAEAPPMLASPLALTWRLQRRALLAWSIGLAAVATVIASSAREVGNLVRDNPGLQDTFERLGGRGAASDLFLSAGSGILGVLAAGYAVQASMRLASEETGLLLEPVLGTAVSRTRWAAGHLCHALLGPAVALFAAGAIGGLVFGLGGGDVGRELPRVLAGALVQLPAAWLAAGVAVALFGLLPRLTRAAWAVLATFLLLWQFGEPLRLGRGLTDLSPFTHLPRIPGGEWTVAPLLILAAIAAALALLGLVGFRRRDVGRT